MIDEAESDKSAEEKNVSMRQLITWPIILFMIITSTGYASVHAFYPNMSKFLQTRFQFTNV